MKIVDIRITGLTGGTVDGGWPQGNKPEDDLNTLVEVAHRRGPDRRRQRLSPARRWSPPRVQLLRPHPDRRARRRAGARHREAAADAPSGRAAAARSSTPSAASTSPCGTCSARSATSPSSRLLGGNYRDRIKPYGSILFDEPAPLRETLQQTVARGFKAIKLGWRPFGRRDRKTDELLIQTARDTVGPDVELMVDAGGSEQFWPHGYKWALETAKMLADYDIVWFEEALPPDDLEGFIELRRHSPVPIATGEVLTRRQSFRPFLERGAVDIIQPDCTKCGGLTEAWRIAWMAYEHNIQWVPHGWNTAIGLAADLHLAAAMPVARYVEYLTPSPYLDEIITEPFQPDAEGYLTIPDKPGLGIELNREALRKYGR